eukprot:gene7924-9443_t
MLFVFLNAFSSFSQSSGIQISWNFSVGCQVYSNEDPRDGKDPIFIEDIAENECLLTCAGQRVTYTLSGSLGPTPDTTWNVNGGTIINETETACTVEWSSKCTVVTPFEIEIEVRPTPTIAISGYNGPVCSETDIALEVVSTDPLNPLDSSSQVNWNANLQSFQGGLSEIFAYENTSTGNSVYTITAQVAILPAPDVSISLHSGANAFCLESQINSVLKVATSNNATVEWFYNTNTGLGVTTETYQPTQFGVYTVWAVNPANGCENESDPFIVYQDYYDILGPVPTAGYTGSSYPVTVAGMYNVLHRAKYECGEDINTYEARKDLLVPYVPQFNYAAVCNGTGNSSFTISVTDNTDFYSPITNRTFAYFIKPTAAPDSSYALMLSSANGTFATTYGSGNYTIKLVVTGDYNGATLDSCESGDIVATPANATVCAGSSNGVLMTYQPNGAECGATYQWMNELTPIPGANSISYTANSPGIYWVKLSSAQNCTYSSPSRIAPVFRVAPSVQLSGATVYCANNFNRNITALTAAGNSISWTVNGQFYGTAPTINLDNLAVGVYNVTATVTDSFGCQNAAGTVVEIIPLPEPPAIEYSLNNCQPYKVDVFVANAGSGIYNWSNGMGGTANTLVNGGPLEIAYTEGGCTVRSQIDIPKDPEFYAWIFPSGCIAACDYKEGFGYLIGPRLPLHYWGWLQDNNIVSEGTDSFPEPFEVTGTGIYNLSYNTGPDVVVVPSSVTVQPGSAQIYSFTIIPVDLMNGGSVTLFFEGVDAEGKPCMTEFSFDLPPCDISFEASKTNADKNNTLSATRQLTIVPNPAKDRVAVHFESFAHNTSLELYDLAGRLLDRFEATEGKGLWDVTVSDYPAGLYIVVLRILFSTLGLQAQCFSNISSGNYFNFGIKPNGTIWGWGSSVFGQMGNGSEADFYVPTQISNATDWQTIVSGPYNTFAIKTNGTMWASGDNLYGQLGTDSDWVMIEATSARVTIALKSNGTLWGWGLNASGLVGPSNVGSRQYPTQLRPETDWATISAGNGHALALKTNGTLWGWGYGGFGQAGDTFPDAYFRDTPVQIGNESNWVYIGTGYSTSYAIKSDGTLWGWGRNDTGQVGDGTTTNRRQPVQVGADTDWIRVTGGWFHGMAQKANGAIYTWGANDFGQLGNGTMDAVSLPTGITVPGCTLNTDEFSTVKMVIAPNPVQEVLQFSYSGNTVINGLKVYDMLGRGVYDSHPVATNKLQVSLPLVLPKGIYLLVLESNGSVVLRADTDWATISVGNSHALALKTNGTLWGWGAGGLGQAGTGFNTSYAIKSDGTLWAWGRNDTGQVGDGTTTNRRQPVQVGTDTDWVRVSGGLWHGIAQKANGAIYTWGTNDFGQLGNGTMDAVSLPTGISVSGCTLDTAEFSTVKMVIAPNPVQEVL